MKLKRHVERSVSGKITVLLLISGILSLVFSIYAESQILTLIGLGLIGLGLTTLGALFLFLKPENFVEGSLLYDSAISAYLTIDRIVDEFNYIGKGYYVPPYPKDVYIPEHLKALRDLVVFISAEKTNKIPGIEEMAKGSFISENPKGVLISPPGLGILTQIEEKFKVDFTRIELNELCNVLPSLILKELNLARKMALELNGDQAHLKIIDSLYQNLHNVQIKLKSVNLLGCPIASAVACALAKTYGRTVAIQKQQVSPNGLAIDVWYRIVKE